MDKDILGFIAITAAAVFVAAIIIYFIAKKRHKEYIVYVDREIVKTANNQKHSWSSLTAIKYINKRILGQGMAEGNYAIVFYFTQGNATIDIKSNIYNTLYTIAKNTKVPVSSVITKGFLKQ